MVKFRLDSIRVENFRSISGDWQVPLDAHVVLIHGPNGSGKTSLLSAIELAASGDVAFLRNQTDQLSKVLLNRSSDLGGVKLRLRTSDGSTKFGTFQLRSESIEGIAALDEAQKIHFVERCFLPQTALGRLLEMYTASGKQVDTALIRFVKSVIGLDDLDSLIEGLHAAGHISRTRSVSSSWGAAETELTRLHAAHDALQEQIIRAEDTQQGHIRNLRELLQDSFTVVPDSDILREIGAFSAQPTVFANELSRLQSLKVRLEGISKAYSGDLDGVFAQAKLAVETAARAAFAFNEWESNEGSHALARLNTLRTTELSLPHAVLPSIFEAFQEVWNLANAENQRRTADRNRRLAYKQSRARLRNEIIRLDREIQKGQDQVRAVNVPNDVRTLIEVLEKIIPIVNSEDCPVCDQPFTHKKDSIKQYLQRKTSTLTHGAEALMIARERVRILEEDAQSLKSEIALIPVENCDDVDDSSDYLTQEINQLESAIGRGLSLINELSRSEAHRAEYATLQANHEVAKRHLIEIMEQLSVVDLDLNISDEIPWLRGLIEEKIKVTSVEQTRHERLIAVARTAEDTAEKIQSLRMQLDSVNLDLEALKAALREAQERKNASNALRIEAERIRSSLINEIFDQSLNTLWADLFSRFIPTEPFVPRFRKQTKASRSVDVRLETVLPNGEVSESPSSVLSYGNTNTAALSLFLALHLSSPSDLPWLIFDDPVQSMDDIHIANFATVIRQLAYAHERQIVIAVHQRELFDYLALELAPASSRESLIKISLDRRGGSSFVSTERVQYVAETALAQVQNY